MFGNLAADEMPYLTADAIADTIASYFEWQRRRTRYESNVVRTATERSELQIP
jgi:hypothetical protein